ncbi:MAG: AAA family ATPase [Chloroflexota bacterium]|nr:AAA family ATPase [Chloroflexota bacterium]
MQYLVMLLVTISGTGKTWLTETYAKAIGADYQLVAVAPNWNTNEDLLGYFNPLDKQYHDTPFSRFLRDAAVEYTTAQEEERPPQPYHLVLDEMNLARVEYYFAKFLSAMEVRTRNPSTTIELAPGEEVLLPSNLYFIGTVNIDETTHGFSDKVYDRAQLIELGISRESLQTHLAGKPYSDLLLQVWDAVREVAPFAFRVIDEIKVYVKEAEELGVPWGEALDEQLLHKILPKLKGADPRLGIALEQLLDLSDNNLLLVHTKVNQMYEGFCQHGFVSFFQP